MKEESGLRSVRFFTADAARSRILFRDLRELIGTDGAEVAYRERLLRHLEAATKGNPLELAKYSLEQAGASFSEMNIILNR